MEAEEKKNVVVETTEKVTKSIYDALQEQIVAADISEDEKNKRLSYLLRLKNNKVNLLIVGPTGVGKSSTINALFNTEVAKVGIGVDPETSELQKYELDNLIIWDTPGLGDNVKRDKQIKKQLKAKLNEKVEGNTSLIDLVLVLIDASSRDLGTSYDLINDLLIPCLGKDAEDRIIIALNQADVAMKGKNWDEEKNEPNQILIDFLEKKAASVEKRIREASGLTFHPIYYCAGYTEEGPNGVVVRKPYNLTKLLYHIVQAIPAEKRLVLADHLNDESDNWSCDDGRSDYRTDTINEFFDSVGNSIAECMDSGFEIGRELLGLPGGVIGGVVGGVFGAIRGTLGSLFGVRW